VVTATSSVPADAARVAESMMAPVTVSELFGLITMSLTAPIVGGPAGKRQRRAPRHRRRAARPISRHLAHRCL